MRTIHKENHLIARIGWLRAAVLGVNDGIISTSSLILGVASANPSANGALLAGVAGLVAGAMSMAAGEYVSVSSQADTENADLARETKELASNPEGETEELAQIYLARGVEAGLARQVALQLMAKDAVGAHSRDELGISDATTARPVQAAMASAATFTVGAAVPWPDRRQGLRRRHLEADYPRDVLGRARHGADNRHRRAIRQGSMRRLFAQRRDQREWMQC